VLPFRTTVRTTVRTIVRKSDAKARLQRQKDLEKKRQIRAEIKFNAMEENPEHPLHMSIQEALRVLRAFEAGKTPDKTTISCQLYVRQELGATPIQTKVDMPFPINRKTNPIVFTSQSHVAQAMKQAGIQNVGGKELLEKFVTKEMIPAGFTHAFATTEMTPYLKSVARILGPAGLQPTAKKGTVTDNINDILDVVNSFHIKQKDGSIAFPVGNCGFTDVQIMSNLKAISDAIHSKIDPEAKKKTRLSNCYITTSRSPGLVIDFK
jgi:ribosomal protein L1